MDQVGPSLRSFGVFVSGLMMAFIFNGSFISNGVLFPETISELETSNFEAGSAYALQAAAAFTIAGFGGAALEGVSYRVLGVTGGFLFGVGLISYGLLGSGLWTLFTFIGITAAGGGLLHFATLMTYLEHFDKKFSVAYSVKELSAFLGISAIPPLMELFRVKYGFHGSFLILGAVSWNCIVCGVLLKPAKGSHQREYTFGNEVLTSLRKGCLQSSYSYYKTKLIYKLSRMSSHSPALRHPNFAIFLVIHSVFYYSFTGWALFVVPFAVSLGHSSQRAVYLSTAGGIGGLAGKLLALVIFFFNKMNPITGAVLPSLGLCIGLLGYIFSEDYLFLMSSSSLCGFAIAYADSALCGMMPQYLCQYHLRQGCCISYLYGGLFMQFGGSACGAILDFTFSYTWLFGTMVIMQVSIGILAVILYLRDPKVEECGADTEDYQD